MSDRSFLLLVYSPAGLIFEETVTSAYLPGATGEIGVLPEHAQYVGALGTGILKFQTLAGETGKVVVSGGFVQMKEKGLHILSDYVVLHDDALETPVAMEKKRLESLLSSADAYSPETASLKEAYARLAAIEELQKAG